MNRYKIAILLMSLNQLGLAKQNLKECVRSKGPLPIHGEITCGEPCIMHPGEEYSMDMVFENRR
jgi:hypothetical protein